MSTLTLKKKTAKKTDAKTKELISEEKLAKLRAFNARKLFTNLDVIKENKLLTIGFGKELRDLCNSQKDKYLIANKKTLQLLFKHCERPEYKALDPLGIRYNIDNKPTHKIVEV